MRACLHVSFARLLARRYLFGVSGSWGGWQVGFGLGDEVWDSGENFATDQPPRRARVLGGRRALVFPHVISFLA